jgi:cell division protein FtsA
MTRFKKERIYCGLDLGGHKIKASILKTSGPKDVELLGIYENRIRGFKDSAVSDLVELSECIHTTLQDLSRRTQIKLRDIQLGIDGEFLEARLTHAMIPLTDRSSKVITYPDIQKVNHQARLLGLKMEEEILHELPQLYQMDEGASALNPLGLFGRKLGVQSLILTSTINHVRNIAKAVHQSGYEVVNTFFTSYAASDVILDDRDRMDGCALIDIGARMTSILIFRERVLKHFYKKILGGDHFTQNIANNLNLTFDLAEELKKSYAVAQSSEKENREEILVKRDHAYIPIKRELISQAISPLTDQIVSTISQALKDSGSSDQLNRGLIMIGGGALLPGLIERIEKDINLPVRLGKFQSLSPQQPVNAALFSSVIGLAQSGFKKDFEHSALTSEEGHWTKRFSSRVRELYQEYF